MSNRGKNPNSQDALRRAVAARKKDAKQVHITLSSKAITSLDELAEILGTTRSGLVEQISRLDRSALLALLCPSEDSP